MVQRLDVAHLGPCTHRKAGAQQAAQTAGQGSRDGDTVHPAHFLPLKDMAAQRQGACEDTGTRGTAHALFGAAMLTGDAGIGQGLSLPEAAAHVRAEAFDDAVDVPPGFDARAKGDDQIRHIRGKTAGLLAHGGVHEDLRTELAQARAIFVHQQGQGLSGLPEGTAGGRIGAQSSFESFHPGLAFEDRLGKDHQTADGTRPGALQQHEPVQARVPQFQGHTGAHVSGTPDDDKGTESFLHHDKNASCRASRQGPGTRGQDACVPPRGGVWWPARVSPV